MRRPPRRWRCVSRAVASRAGTAARAFGGARRRGRPAARRRLPFHARLGSAFLNGPGAYATAGIRILDGGAGARTMHAHLACLLLPALAAAAGLRDDPIGAAALTYLDGTDWTWTSGDGASLPASVPGDLISDLAEAGIIGDPLVDSNFYDDAAEWNKTWTISTTFDGGAAAGARVALVFDGVKMGASIKLNGKALGAASDQFLRYRRPSGDLARWS